MNLQKVVRWRIRKLAEQILLPLRALPVKNRLAQPLGTWPSVLGTIHRIHVPRGVPFTPVPTATCPANINIILALINETVDIPGDLAECGVYRGASLVPMAVYLRQKNIRKHILGFDSFQGFDVVTKEIALGTRDMNRRSNRSSNTSERLVRCKLRRFEVEENVTLVPGYFCDTLQTYAESRFSFVHLDSDTYESYSECLRFFYPRMNQRGIILFDEYNDQWWPGCNLALDEFLADKPEKLQLITRDNYQKFYIQKCVDA
jgi:O-methyltransferase